MSQKFAKRSSEYGFNVLPKVNGAIVFAIKPEELHLIECSKTF
jgi:hypothetical protein